MSFNNIHFLYGFKDACFFQNWGLSWLKLICSMFFGIISLCYVGTAQAQFIELTPGKDAQAVHADIWFSKDFSKSLDELSFENAFENLEKLEAETIHFGPPSQPILVLIPVTNSSDKDGSWILTTGRGALKSFTLFELTKEDNNVLLSSTDKEKFRRNLRDFQAISWEVVLKKNESRYYGFLFESKNSTYLPLKIQTYTNFFKDRRVNIAMVAGVVIGTAVLIFLNIILFFVTEKKEFIWLGLAELSFALNTLHAEGYTSIFLFPNNPVLSLTFGDIVKCTFAITMSQFARSFIQTHKFFPKIDVILQSFIYLGLGIIVLIFGESYYGDSLRKVLFYTAWLVAVMSTLFLPFVGIIATQKLGKEYWPLIIAWGSLGLFVFYSAFASSGLFKSLPINWHLAAPIGLFESVMVTLALGLHIRKIQSDRITADKNLTMSLKERLEISEHANRLATENAMAIATIHDQSSLLHASGHDSQQVIMALKSAVHFMSGNEKFQDNKEVSNILQSSANFLESIVATTMSTPTVSIDKQTFMALSGFTAQEFCEPLTMIYGRVCRDKDLQLVTDIDEEVFIVSDRALLMRAISNFLSNSLKFTQFGHLELSIKQDNKNVSISIIDTGIGIDKVTADALNERDKGRWKGNNSFAGTGAGYLTSKKIILSLGGTVKIMPRDEGGTKVDVCVPLLVKNLTDCNLTYIEKTLENYEFKDLDGVDSKLSSTSLMSSKKRILVSYDDSTQTRQRISELSHIMLLKPLYKEMCDHPSLRM